MIRKLLILFYRFFLIGLFTIGGGYAMIPMITEAVISEGWMSMDELINFFAIAESTPGPFAVNTATMVGFTFINESPILGAVVATTAVVLPSFVIIYIIAKNFRKLIENKYVTYALVGIRAVALGLILSVVWFLISKSLGIGEGSFDFYALIIIVIIFTASKIFKKTGPIPLLILSGLLGYIFYGLL